MSQPTVAIIDYQLSNLFSVRHACEFLGVQPVITSDPNVLRTANAAILPGVGAFGDAMANLTKFGMVEAIHEFIASGKSFMGVCLGLQLLLSTSTEFGSFTGLNLIPGTVDRFPERDTDGQALKVPQIGWNQIAPPSSAPARWEHTPLAHVQADSFMYFVHSFYAKPERDDDVAAVTTYGGLTYCSSLSRDNIFATQFHPEKSGQSGITIYRDWLASIS